MARLPVVVHVLAAVPKSSALLNALLVSLTPPTTRTSPDGSKVAVWRRRPLTMLPVVTQPRPTMGVGVGAGDALGVALGETDGVSVGAGLNVGVEVGEGLGVAGGTEGVGVASGVGLGVAGTGDGVGVATGAPQ